MCAITSRNSGAGGVTRSRFLSGSFGSSICHVTSGRTDGAGSSRPSDVATFELPCRQRTRPRGSPSFSRTSDACILHWQTSSALLGSAQYAVCTMTLGVCCASEGLSIAATHTKVPVAKTSVVRRFMDDPPVEHVDLRASPISKTTSADGGGAWLLGTPGRGASSAHLHRFIYRSSTRCRSAYRHCVL